MIMGASGHGKVVADIAVQCGYEAINFLDDDTNIRNCGRYKVIGRSSDFKRFVDINTEFFVAIGNAVARQNIQKMVIDAGGEITVLIHPDAVVAAGVKMGKGSVVMAGTVINTSTVVGKGCIINTASSVDHDCIIGDFVHIAVGAHLAGTVTVGSNTWIGAGAIISNNVKICGNCMIGAGAVVVEDITIAGTYMGVPARRKDEARDQQYEKSFDGIYNCINHSPV